MSYPIRIEVIKTDDGIFYEDQGGELIAVPCQWFARCDRPATNTEPHPVMGDVPCCQQCFDWNQKLKLPRP